MPRNEFVTEDDVNMFTAGDCHVFAHHVNRITGWPICVFYCAGPDLHAFNLTPRRRPFDVLGEQKWREFRKSWSSDPYREVSYRLLRDTFGKAQFPESHKRARELAPLVVEAYRA